MGWHPQSLEENERWPGERSASQRNWVALGWWTYVTLVSLCACDGSGFVAQTHQGHGTRCPQSRIAWSMHFFRLLCRSAWTLGNGSNTMFWTDRWISSCSVGHTTPYLLATMPTRPRRLSVSSALTNRALGHGYPWTMDGPSDH